MDIRMHLSRVFVFCICFGVVFSFLGCATPVNTVPSQVQVLNPDEDDGMGGSFLGSQDIRTMAQQMCGELLSLPEINGSGNTVRVSTDTIKNSTRYLIDTGLLLKRLRLDLNRYSQGQLRFFAQNAGQNVRRKILSEQHETDVDGLLDEAAAYIAGSSIIQDSREPVRIKVSPTANTNLFNMNADSFAAMLRSKIKEQAGEKVLFARPGSDASVDYTLTGQFFAESIQKEGTANIVEDLEAGQKNPEVLYDDPGKQGDTSVGVQLNVGSEVQSSRIKVGANTVYGVIDPALWASPNVTKSFIVMLVDNSEMAVLEKTIDLEKEMTSGVENSNYILTGEISSLSKAGGGNRSDYVLVSFYLIEPETNEIIWEYGYETKKVTSRSVIYR